MHLSIRLNGVDMRRILHEFTVHGRDGVKRRKVSNLQNSCRLSSKFSHLNVRYRQSNMLRLHQVKWYTKSYIKQASQHTCFLAPTVVAATSLDSVKIRRRSILVGLGHMASTVDYKPA